MPVARVRVHVVMYIYIQLHTSTRSTGLGPGLATFLEIKSSLACAYTVRGPTCIDARTDAAVRTRDSAPEHSRARSRSRDLSRSRARQTRSTGLNYNYIIIIMHKTGPFTNSGVPVSKFVKLVVVYTKHQHAINCVI